MPTPQGPLPVLFGLLNFVYSIALLILVILASIWLWQQIQKNKKIK